MLSSNPAFLRLFPRVKQLIESTASRDENLAALCALLKDAVPYYNWVGVYFLDEHTKSDLVLGPFAGAPTEHIRIPFGIGVCGQAAVLQKTVIVPDVRKEQNYLSCSPFVKAEIVVPISFAGAVRGVLDIDSHDCAPFTAADRAFLERVCALIARLLVG
ncbi:MAG: GAF domain-containing protein [Methanomicrobia archaeon]|nr:GAF domain-containing protein [Methanomicrobia archaeon]